MGPGTASEGRGSAATDADWQRRRRRRCQISSALSDRRRPLAGRLRAGGGQRRLSGHLAVQQHASQNATRVRQPDYTATAEDGFIRLLGRRRPDASSRPKSRGERLPAIPCAFRESSRQTQHPANSLSTRPTDSSESVTEPRSCLDRPIADDEGGAELFPPAQQAAYVLTPKHWLTASGFI